MKKTLIFSCILILANAICSGQIAKLEVESFKQLLEPMTVEMQQKDLNGAICALVKIVLPINGCQFEGNVIGNPQFKVNEYWVYVTSGSKTLQIKCPDHYPLRLDFDSYGVASLKEKAIYQLVVKSNAPNGSADQTGLLMPNEVKDLRLNDDLSIEYIKNISVTDLITVPFGLMKVNNHTIWDIPIDDYAVAAERALQLGLFTDLKSGDLSWVGTYMKNERASQSFLTVDNIQLWQAYPIIENENKLRGFGYIFAPFYESRTNEELSAKKIIKMLSPMIAKIKMNSDFKQIKRAEYVNLRGYAYGEEGAYFRNEKTSEILSLSVSGNTAIFEICKL